MILQYSEISKLNLSDALLIGCGEVGRRGRMDPFLCCAQLSKSYGSIGGIGGIGGVPGSLLS